MASPSVWLTTQLIEQKSPHSKPPILDATEYGLGAVQPATLSSRHETGRAARYAAITLTLALTGSTRKAVRLVGRCYRNSARDVLLTCRVPQVQWAPLYRTSAIRHSTRHRDKPTTNRGFLPQPVWFDWIWCSADKAFVTNCHFWIAPPGSSYECLFSHWPTFAV